MTGLPQGWSSAEVGEICDLLNGRAFKPSDWTQTGLPIVRIQNLNNPEKPYNHYSGEVRERFLIETGDLLFAWSGTPGTSFGAHVWSGGKAVLNQHIFNMKFDTTNIDRDYFKGAINQKLNELIAKAHGGAGLQHVTKGKFEETNIPLPPLPEQRRIVRKLDTLTARTTTARTHLNAIEKLVERYKLATLAQAFRGNLTTSWRVSTPLNLEEFETFSEATNVNFQTELENWQQDIVRWESGDQSISRPKKPRQPKPPSPISKAQKDAMWSLPKNWDWVQIGSMAFVTKLAGFEYTDYVRYDESGDLSVLKAENAGKDGFRPTAFSKVVSSTVANLTRSQIFGGEILVVFVGAGVGNVAAVPEGQRFFLGPNIGMVRPHTNSLNSLYLEYFLRSVEGKQLLLSEAKAVAQPSISMGAIRNTPVPVCHPAEQREIVCRIETAFAKIDRLAAEAAKALKLVGHLDQCILAKAFAGELVPQDPTDEPAETLLARIRAARDAAPKAKRRRRTSA